MRILHFNDEEHQLHRYLAHRCHKNEVIVSGRDPFPIVRSERFDAAFVGLHPYGMRLMHELHQNNPDCFVTIITSDHETRRAVEAIKAGAFDYLLSPLDFAEVQRICLLMSRDERRKREQRRLQEQLASATGAPDLVGSSEAMGALRDLIGKAAVTTAPVLLSGETGTGKELIARILHAQSPRRGRPFLSINCNAIPTSLLESELFGHRKGAFTGADADRQGLLEQARGGTFLFDEISDLELPLQGKILRVLEEGQILPVGARKLKRLDVRFIAATNRDLVALVRQQQFRSDLYFRLNVVPIHVPPLRQRMEDVVPLVRHFIERYVRHEGRRPLRVAPAVWRWFSQYHWPGNVRELENLCRRAVALTDGDTFDTDVLALSDSFSHLSEPVAPSGPPAPRSLHLVRQQTEYRAMEEALAAANGNISAAARSLGISRTTFYAKVRQMGIDLQRGYRAAHLVR